VLEKVDAFDGVAFDGVSVNSLLLADFAENSSCYNIFSDK
jgi:hypothetical protein